MTNLKNFLKWGDLMADGMIRVGTKLDLSGIKKDIKELEKEIAKADREANSLEKQKEKVTNKKDERLIEQGGPRAAEVIERQANAVEKIEKKQEAITKKADEWRELLRQAREELDRINNIQSASDELTGVAKSADYEEKLLGKIGGIEEYNSKLDETRAKMAYLEQEAERIAIAHGISKEEVLQSNMAYRQLATTEKILADNADRFSRESASGFASARDAADGLTKSIRGGIKTMMKYTLAIFGARSVFFAVKGAMRQYIADNEALSQSVAGIKGAFSEMLGPAVEYVVKVVSYAMAYLNLFIKILTGVDFAARYNAKALKKQADATSGAVAAQKEYNKQLAGFDEMNKLNEDGSTSGVGSGGVGSSAGLELPDVSGGKFEEVAQTIKDNLALIAGIVSGALVAVGAIFLAAGKIPLGVALIAAGLAGLYAESTLDYDKMPQDVRDVLTAITEVLGMFLLGIGAVLAFTSANVPLGIGLMLAGAASLGAAVALNWNSTSGKLEQTIKDVELVVSLALLSVGAVLALSGANVPLGIGLLCAGAVGLVTNVALNWNDLPQKTKDVIGVISLLVSSALLVVGAVLAFSGTNLPLGIALIAAGALSMIASVRLTWNSLSDKVRNTISVIGAVASSALLALGIILCVTGAALPLGVALIAAGAAGLVTVSSLNKDAIKQWASDCWSRVTNWFNAKVKPVFTKKYWADKFDSIKQGMKSALNGVISSIESGINNIVRRINNVGYTIPDWIPIVGGKRIGVYLDTVSIPRLAQGGIVNNPGRGVSAVIGEAGAEAVLPLERNTEWMDMLADKIGGGNVTIPIYLDGKKIYNYMVDIGNKKAFATNGA